MFWGRLEAAWVVAAIQVGGDGKACLGVGGSRIVENLLIGVQRFTSPVSRYLREEAMFDRVPFGSAGRIVGHGNGQGVRVGQLGLKLRLPGITAMAVAAAGVGQDKNLARAGVATGTFLLPPMGDGMGGESGSVVRNTHHKGAVILGDVVDAIRNGDADGVGAEVVVKDTAGAAFPTAAGIPEVADQFTLFCVDADDGQMTALEAASQLGEIFELEISIRAVAGGDLLMIDAQRIAHLIEQPRDSIGTDGDTELAKFLGYSDSRAARPAQASHGIAGSVVLQQAVQDVDYVRLFFSVGWRPPPWRRVRPLTTLRSNSC